MVSSENQVFSIIPSRSKLISCIFHAIQTFNRLIFFSNKSFRDKSFLPVRRLNLILVGWNGWTQYFDGFGIRWDPILGLILGPSGWDHLTDPISIISLLPCENFLFTLKLDETLRKSLLWGCSGFRRLEKWSWAS